MDCSFSNKSLFPTMNSFFSFFLNINFEMASFIFKQTIIYIATYSSNKNKTKKVSKYYVIYILLFVKKKNLLFFGKKERNKEYKIHEII